MKKRLIVCLPVAGVQNPYQQLMMDGLNDSGTLRAIHGVDDRFLGIIRSAVKHRPEYIHFDWIVSYYYRRWGWLTFLSVPLFFFQIWFVNRVLGSRIVWTLHNIYPHDIGAKKLHHFCQMYFIKKCEWIRFFGEETAKKAVEIFGIDLGKVRIVPEGDYTKTYPNSIGKIESRKYLSIDSEVKVILYLGFIRPYKGIHELIQAFEQLNGDNHLLIIAGQVRDAAYSRDLSKKAGPNVRMVMQFIPQEDLQYYFLAANIVVLPFTSIDNSGSVIMAMGFGKPIIAPATGEIAYRLRDQKELLYDHMNELSGKLEFALSLPEGALESIGNRNYANLKNHQWNDFQKNFSMKILFATNTFENVQNGPSKFARAVLDINHMTFDKNVQIRILTEDISSNSPHLIDGTVFKADVRTNAFTRPWGFIYRMFPYHRAAKELHKTYPFDILIFNNTITGIWSAISFKIPVIGMLNDYTSMHTGFNDFKWEYEWFRRMIFKQFEQVAIRVLTGTIVNSRYMAAETIQCYGIRNKKLRTLTKGISIGGEPAYRDHFHDPVKVLFVKADYVLGGLNDIISALSKLAAYQFELTVIGPSERFRKQIDDMVSAHNIRHNFLGPVAGNVVEAFMRDSDLFIVPSYREALGVANMQALAQGLTVISSNAGGIPEVLDEGKNGWLVPPGNPVELARAIEEAIANPDLRKKKSVEGFLYVQKHFAVETTLRKLVDISFSFL